ncbi:hypothetical protein GYH30_056878 [Glycine max]|uniref:Uncharacterized protein n=1 Tax=Glycine max TaxID=3847 RepID=K7N5D4_SOYBN|nr:hypothetical protein GYH30_056878 [Glycine max]
MVEVHSLTPTSREAISSYEARTLQPLTVFGVRHASVSVSDTDTTLVLRSIFWTLQVSTCPMSVSVLVLHRFPGIETVTSRSQGNKLVLAPRLTFYLIQRSWLAASHFVLGLFLFVGHLWHAGRVHTAAARFEKGIDRDFELVLSMTPLN